MDRIEQACRPGSKIQTTKNREFFPHKDMEKKNRGEAQDYGYGQQRRTGGEASDYGRDNKEHWFNHRIWNRVVLGPLYST
jgi:hypothetical protein